MNPKYITLSLVEFFKTAEEGEHHPFNVRTELGLSVETWRMYARAYLYPPASEARQELAKVGVIIRSVKRERVGDQPLMLSIFHKAPVERHCAAERLRAAGDG